MLKLEVKKSLLFFFSFLILITCQKDAFEEEDEAPVVLIDVEVAAGEGGSVSSSGGSFESGSTVTIYSRSIINIGKFK